MIYLFHSDAGNATLSLEGDSFKHMIKARRHVPGDELQLRQKDDPFLSTYRIDSVGKKDAVLSLVKSEPIKLTQDKQLHLGWSLIDPKSIEKVLPSLCELGVTKITLLYARRSQHQFKIDIDRLERIILNSMQQSGRFDMLQIQSGLTLETFVKQNPDALVLDFCETPLKKDDSFQTVILGPEGGFSEEEKELLEDLTTRKLQTPMVLRSETAAIAISSMMLL